MSTGPTRARDVPDYARYAAVARRSVRALPHAGVRIWITGEYYKWLLDRGKVVERTGDGAPLKVVGISLDIDVRKRMEAALRESEERFRDAFEFAAIGMALVAPDGRFLRVNRSLCRIVGYSSEELLATDFQAITHPDDLDADLGHVRQMLDGSLSHFHMDKRYLHKDGHIVWSLLSVSLVRDVGGQPLYFVAQIEDISARAVAEARLVESELRYRTTADLVPGGVSPLTESRGSLVQSLRQICELATASGHASVDFEAAENASLTLPWQSRDHLHRIAQEALNNALRHSNADNIVVTIQIEPTSVRLEVVDNGKGLSASGAPPSGRGLDSMRQRAAAIGASLLVETRSTGGAAIVCECPQPRPVAEPGNA